MKNKKKILDIILKRDFSRAKELLVQKVKQEEEWF